MTFLSAHLPFPEQDAARQHPAALPPPRSHLVITDTLPSPGHFAVYHAIAAGIARRQKVVWVDFRAEGRSSLEAVLRRMSVVLPTAPGGFAHIAPSSLPPMVPLPAPAQGQPRMFDADDVLALRPTVHAVQQHLAQGALVVLDGLADVLAMGGTPADLHQFVRAVQAHTRQVSGILISTLHVGNPGAESIPQHDLLERLLRTAHAWWRIEGLASGRSGDVHGEISSFPLALAGQGWPAVSRAQPLQYRLEASTVKVFPKGTGRGYL